MKSKCVYYKLGIGVPSYKTKRKFNSTQGVSTIFNVPFSDIYALMRYNIKSIDFLVGNVVSY